MQPFHGSASCIFNEVSPDREEDRFARIRDEALQLIWVFEESFMRIFASNLWSRDIKNNLLIKKESHLSSLWTLDSCFGSPQGFLCYCPQLCIKINSPSPFSEGSQRRTNTVTEGTEVARDHQEGQAEPSSSFVRDTCQDQMSEGTFVDGRLCSHLARLSLFTRTARRNSVFYPSTAVWISASDMWVFFFLGYCTTVMHQTLSDKVK